VCSPEDISGQKQQVGKRGNSRFQEETIVEG